MHLFECDWLGNTKCFDVFDIWLTAFKIFDWMWLGLSLELRPQFKDLYLPLEKPLLFVKNLKVIFLYLTVENKII